MKTPARIRRRAIKVSQSKEHPLYLFSLTAEELLLVADISRVSRDEGGKLIGYQRPEVRRHVTSIVDYLNGPEVLFELAGPGAVDRPVTGIVWTHRQFIDKQPAWRLEQLDRQ